jgi:hypothetical protein
MFESEMLLLELFTTRVPSSSTVANATSSCGPAWWPPVAATAAPPMVPARATTSAASLKRLGLLMIDLLSCGNSDKWLPQPSIDSLYVCLTSFQGKGRDLHGALTRL